MSFYEQVKHDAFDVIGIDVVTDNSSGKAADDINMLWQRFMTEDVLMNVPSKADNTIFGVYTDYQGDHTKPYRLIIGCRVTKTDTIPAGMTHVRIPQGIYGKFIAAGEQPKSLLKGWETIWSSDIDRLYDVDFEVYGPRFFDPATQEALIYIGMKNKKPN